MGKRKGTIEGGPGAFSFSGRTLGEMAAKAKHAAPVKSAGMPKKQKRK